MTEYAESPAQPLPKGAPQPWYRRLWVQVVAAVVAVGTGLAGLWWIAPTDQLQWFYDKLPATLPLLSVALSIGLGVRDLSSWAGWLARSKELSLGALSFAIWYLVAAQNLPIDQRYIRVSSDTFLSRDYAVIVALVAVTWVALCSVAREQTTRLAEGTRSGWALVQAILLGFSLVGLLAPFLLFESRKVVEDKLGRSLDERSFSVSIPYEDEQFNACYRPRNPLHVYVAPEIRAKTPGDAIRMAMTTFTASAESQQSAVCRLPEGRPVKVRRELITVQETQAINILPPADAPMQPSPNPAAASAPARDTPGPEPSAPAGVAGPGTKQ